MTEDLRTAAPEVPRSEPHQLTGNLVVSVPSISQATASIDRIGTVSDALVGLLEACGDSGQPFVTPVLDEASDMGSSMAIQWALEDHWVPRFTRETGSGLMTGWILAPLDEHERHAGLALRLCYQNTSDETRQVEIGWRGAWRDTELTRFRSRRVHRPVEAVEDAWTGTCVLSSADPTLPLAVGVRGGEGVSARAGADGGWSATARRTVAPGEQTTVDLFLAVAREADGAGVTALALRRLGFHALRQASSLWLRRRELPAPDPEVFARLNRHLFFNYFYAQADCLDSGAPVMLTSRSQGYYVSAAFWSRDAYCWTFPALLLADPVRSRQVLLESITRAGPNLAHHALYLNGTSLYPGFELDQAAAPILAVWRYVSETGDSAFLSEPPITRLLDTWVADIEHWYEPGLGLYGTQLMPTDDPTEHPYLLTDNALVAAAFEAAAALADVPRGTPAAPEPSHDDLRERAMRLRVAMRDHLVTSTAQTARGEMWAWACDAEGDQEVREEPPLSLRLLPYLGFCDPEDPRHTATLRWLRDGYQHFYAGRFGGLGAPHFPHPSGFDLAARLLSGDTEDEQLLPYFAGVPMDNGVGCESWDPETGVVATGAQMASMSGYLAWSCWAHLAQHTRWNQPLVGPGRSAR